MRPRNQSIGWFRHSKTGSVLYAPGRARREETAIVVPTPTTSLECVSESGSATMCGFSEFTTPSTPPRKYLRLDPAGSWMTCNWTEPFSATCADDCNDKDYEIYRGAGVYDPSDCSFLSTIAGDYYRLILTPGSPPPTTTPCVPSDGIFITSFLYGAAFAPGWLPPGHYTLLESQTVRTWAYDNVCVAVPFGRISSGIVTATLSEEDTETTAISRATDTEMGVSCTAKISPRGPGVFTFDFVLVNYTISVGNLVDGLDYRLFWRTDTQDYGGGSSSIVLHQLDFTASGTTHSVSDLLACPSGKQVEIFDVSTVYVP